MDFHSFARLQEAFRVRESRTRERSLALVLCTLPDVTDDPRIAVEQFVETPLTATSEYDGMPANSGSSTDDEAPFVVAQEFSVASGLGPAPSHFEHLDECRQPTK